MLDKPLIPFGIIGISTKVRTENFIHFEACLQEHLFWHFPRPGQNVFLAGVSLTFINKTDLFNVKTFGGKHL